MDINLCIDHLGLNRNTYRLTRSAPPHEFIEWNGPDAQPTQTALESACPLYTSDAADDSFPGNHGSRRTIQKKHNTAKLHNIRVHSERLQ